jgi:hypothetical protein
LRNGIAGSPWCESFALNVDNKSLKPFHPDHSVGR